MRLSLDLLFHTVNDIERVGDLSENIAELAESSIKSKDHFSDNAKSELIDLYNKVLEAYTLSLEAMKQSNINFANDVLKIEEEVDALDKLYRAKHMNRLNSNSCSIDSGIIYLDLLTNLERISDHSASIAKRVLTVNQTA